MHYIIDIIIKRRIISWVGVVTSFRHTFQMFLALRTLRRVLASSSKLYFPNVSSLSSFGKFCVHVGESISTFKCLLQAITVIVHL